MKYNQDNEIVKYNFFESLEQTKGGKDPKTVTQYVNAIHEFEIANSFKDLRQYNKDWAITFKYHLNDKKNQDTGRSISKSYYFHYLSHVRVFFEWLTQNEKNYKKIKQKDIDFLGTTRNEINQARATNYQESHKIADIISTIRNMPNETKIEKRNKAILSLYLLTCPRTGSLQEARVGRIKYFDDYDAWAFIQDPRLQNTKYSKNIISFFIGQVSDIIDNVTKWQDYLVSQGFKDKDYLFPKIIPCFTKDGSVEMVLTKDYIRSSSQIIGIVKKAFVKNRLRYLKPHSFRHSIARMARKSGGDVTNTLISLTENYGHKSGLAIIFSSYGEDPLAIRAKVIKSIKLE